MGAINLVSRVFGPVCHVYPTVYGYILCKIEKHEKNPSISNEVIGIQIWRLARFVWETSSFGKNLKEELWKFQIYIIYFCPYRRSLRRLGDVQTVSSLKKEDKDILYE